VIGPWFHRVDASVAWLLADHARLCLWAASSGVLSMLLYKWTSPQARIRALDAETAAARQALARHDGEFTDALPLIRTNLLLALRRVRVALVPSLLAGVPVIVCLIGLETSYGTFEFLPWGPAWLRWWLTGFIVISSVAAVTTKFALRIK
jgi:hypothetical protein